MPAPDKVAAASGAISAPAAANSVSDIEAVADHADAKTFHLVGEAIGGAITLIFAAERPKRLRTLSVLAPAVWANDWIRNAYAVGYPSWVEAISYRPGFRSVRLVSWDLPPS